MEEISEMIGAVFWVVVAIVAIVPLILFAISYKRIGSRNLLLTTIAFGMFFLKGLLFGLRLVIPESLEDTYWYFDDGAWLIVAAILDIFIIGLITASLLLKRKTDEDEPKKKGKKKKEK